MHYPIIALMHGSHGLSAQRYQAGPKGRSLEVGARRAPRLLHIHICHTGSKKGLCYRSTSGFPVAQATQFQGEGVDFHRIGLTAGPSSKLSNMEFECFRL